MLRLPSSWVWDFWLADDGERFHLFFLQASRALHDPERRHLRAGVGHAVSTDLIDWEVLADALVAADEPAYDDQATWTGSVLRDPAGGWRMFYTGVSRGAPRVQRILSATSPDLLTWHRDPGVLVEADPEAYDLLDLELWGDQAWRDPWVYPDPGGAGWHMLITARSGPGDPFARGVVGHATSSDLREWRVGRPLSEPGSGFGQLEVLQVVEVEGTAVLLFSCLGTELSAERRAAGERGGVWAVDADSVLGPFDVSSAHLLLGEDHYVGRLVQDRSGAWQLLAFLNEGPDGSFVGAICDPLPVSRRADGRLGLTRG